MANRILIAYYSRKGQNYVSGNIVNLPIGNTEVVAYKIKELTGADTFEIQTLKQYPKDYRETTKIAADENRNNARPELMGKVLNMNDYDMIYLGYPNWYGTFPMAVFTFLESYDFTGKTIIPFCTHEGSGMGSSENDIQRICKSAKVNRGIAIWGSAVQKADAQLVNWINNSK